MTPLHRLGVARVLAALNKRDYQQLAGVLNDAFSKFDATGGEVLAGVFSVLTGIIRQARDAGKMDIAPHFWDRAASDEHLNHLVLKWRSSGSAAELNDYVQAMTNLVIEIARAAPEGDFSIREEAPELLPVPVRVVNLPEAQPGPMDVRVVSMPARETHTTVERDRRGQIESVEQIERDRSLGTETERA